MKALCEEIKKGFVYLDGGCGTILQAAGLKPGELPELWNFSQEEVIISMHYDYLAAGCHIISANTFGANALKFPEEGETSLFAVIQKAVNNAKTAIQRAKEGGLCGERRVALDVGPLGKLLKPLGDLDFEDAVTIFKKTMRAGLACGVQVILIETMNDLYEAKAALLAAKEVLEEEYPELKEQVPIFLTTAYDETEKLLTGADPKAVVAVLEGLGVDALGVNCSLGPDQMMGIVEKLVTYSSVPVIVCPNAGLPKTVEGKTVFDFTPELFQEAMVRIADLGASILGGCCGTTPKHIEAMIQALKGQVPKPVTDKAHTLIASYTHAVEFSGKPVLIGERINPTGKKKFKQALRDHDIDYILQEALTQQDRQAQVLDVNVGLPEIDEVALMEEIVQELQAVTNLPLQIDTTNPEAMEKALRRYNGKAMINSVNGKEEIMAEVFPLAKKYGGLVVALTIDEEGIPTTAEGRIRIAEKIYRRAADYGIAAKDIIIDPLAMSISAEPNSACVTLDALEGITKKLGGKTSLGVSNISFGLPNRDYVNATFFTMAMQRGLSAAIMNPGSMEMMKAYYSFCALQALDENCAAYITYAPELAKLQASAPIGAGAANAAGIVGAANAAGIAGSIGAANAAGIAGSAGAANAAALDKQETSPLIQAIQKGLKERAAVLTKQLLETKTPLELIDGELIPALDIVGKGFEAKTVFLPQLLMAAEAAGGAFEVIKEYMKLEGKEEEKKGKLVLATVKGDIHDIGKNIVKVLLENYGYDVVDLGKDVDPALVVQMVKDQNIKLVGLSALMTTTVPAMEETIQGLRKEGLEAKVVVGGAVLTQEYADMIGADKYAKDAMETVRYAEEILRTTN